MAMAAVVSRGMIGGRMSLFVRRGFSAYTGLPDPPATGFQYYDASGTGLTTQSLHYGASPAVGSADVGKVQLVTTQKSYPIATSADGILGITVGSDTSRQSTAYDIFRATDNAFSSGAKTAWLNNRVPQFIGTDAVIILAKNATVTATDLTVYWIDGDGDTVTVTAQSALPGTLNDSLAGVTPNANSITDAVFRGMDLTGEYTDGTLRIVIGKVVPPSVAGLSVADATLALNAAAFSIGTQSLAANALAAGLIISQSPTGEADYGSAVNVIVSTGPQSSPPPVTTQTNLITRPLRNLRDFLLG